MHHKQLICVTADKQLYTHDDSRVVSKNLLCSLHDVPAAAVLHEWPFLWLLSEVHLIGAFPKLTLEARHEGVRRPRPVTVGGTPVSVVAAVAHVAVTLQRAQRFVAEVEKVFKFLSCQGSFLTSIGGSTRMCTIKPSNVTSLFTSWHLLTVLADSNDK